jgi:hypothetical protein
MSTHLSWTTEHSAGTNVRDPCERPLGREKENGGPVGPPLDYPVQPASWLQISSENPSSAP